MSAIDFFTQKRITGIVILLLLLSIICQIMIGVLYQKMIKAADNMAVAQNRLLKQCKLKFANCYQLNNGVVNVGIFVDKFLNKIRLGGMSLIGMEHLAGQLMLLSVFCAGLGVCKGIIEGQTIGSLLPYYIVSLFGLYLYFSVSSTVDIGGKRRILKTSIVDYLENNMLNHLQLILDGPKELAGQLYAEEEGSPAGKKRIKVLAAEAGSTGADSEGKAGRKRKSKDTAAAGEGDEQGSVPAEAAASRTVQETGTATGALYNDAELEELLKEFLA